MARNALICAVLLAPAGCARPPVTHPSATNASLQIVLAAQPPTLRQLDPARFTVTLKDRQGHAVTGAAVTMDLTMTTMTMPQNTVALMPQAPGTYEGACQFTMSGDWRATVTAARGGDRTQQTFPVTVQ